MDTAKTAEYASVLTCGIAKNRGHKRHHQTRSVICIPGFQSGLEAIFMPVTILIGKATT